MKYYECEVCGDFCHGLLQEDGSRLPRCLKHLPESEVTDEPSADGDTGGAAKRKGKRDA